MTHKNFVLLISSLIFICSCRNVSPINPDTLVTEQQAGLIIKEMTKIMTHDISNPPLASRFFSYACLAGYEVIAQNNSSFKSMKGVLNDYPEIKKQGVTNYSYRVAALYAMLNVIKDMQPSGKNIESLESDLYNWLKKSGAAVNTLDSSVKYGRAISQEILAYAKEDGYRLISGYDRYSPTKGEGNWFPTPPLYLNPIEPYFNKVRTFHLDSPSQFRVVPPVTFSGMKSSEFYHLMKEVYDESKSSNQATRDIAAFWDCNPFAVLDKGHLQFGIKKISPGAHWMGIAGIACKKSNFSFDSTLLVYTVLSTALMDAFNTCWDEKYRSNRVRPETVIRQYMDSSWQPFLQTPPFPEYPSGHSVISSTSAVILSYFFGDKYEYTDTVEKEFGLPDRTYSSFTEAASEAAISRMYGGIHFMDAITEGQKTGNEIGKFILRRYFE